ncbi:hypothetical protein ACVIW0_002146 [Bradyrhizobium sp. USDA 4454]
MHRHRADRRNQTDTKTSHLLGEFNESRRITIGDPLLEHDFFFLDQATLALPSLNSCTSQKGRNETNLSEGVRLKWQIAG